VVAGRVTLPVRLSTVDDTRAYGAKLAAVLRAGDLVVLTGPLGAGKTALVQGIGAGLGVRGPVLSPTFVIARVHRPGRLPLVHVDAYRLGSFAEVDEWGSGKVEQLADSHLEIEIARTPDSEMRTLTLRPRGGDWSERISALM